MGGGFRVGGSWLLGCSRAINDQPSTINQPDPPQEEPEPLVSDPISSVVRKGGVANRGPIFCQGGSRVGQQMGLYMTR